MTKLYEPWTPDIIVYHSPCDDGFGAALAAFQQFGLSPEYFEGSYGGPLPDVAGKNVLVVDFSFPAAVLRAMAGAAKSIIVLDHHKTAKEALAEFDQMPEGVWIDGEGDDNVMAHLRPGEPLVRFDMNKSGARLAWEFINNFDTVPWLIRFIEDRDLWKFELEGTKAVSMYLRSYPFELVEWQAILEMLEDDTNRAAVIREGQSIQRFFDKKVEEVAEQANVVAIGDSDVPCVNANWAFSSDVCHRLLELYPNAEFAASYFDTKDGKRQFSLRSSDDRADVSAVAKRYGGGGHRNAAGFTLAHGMGPTAVSCAPGSYDDPVRGTHS